ncbi:MAG: hypothetical protein J6336_12015 [Kiritimatiellae bacterium]|nr:hypothetical protein [Kiritimatiellia bacterium]
MRKPLAAILRVAAGIAVVWVIYWMRGNRYSRLYPVLMSGIAFSLFAVSLFRTPLVERFARRMGERLDEAGVRYCRKVTVAWTLFLAIHLAVTVWTLFLPLRVWAFYNGCLAYLLMGAMFIGEWLIRRRVRKRLS